MNCEFLQLSEQLDPSTHFNSNYPYFSGYSKTWIAHCQNAASTLAVRFDIGLGKKVLEIASNDGTYIKNFLNFGAEVQGIEPSSNVASFAESQGVPTLVEFFTKSLAQKLKESGAFPDLILGSNVLAHVPDIRDFLSGISTLLKDDAVAVFEFPHATKMIEHVEFDTIYHEHYSYLNLTPLKELCSQLGLKIFDVETHELHGGSLRIFLSPINSDREVMPSLNRILDYERDWSPTSFLIRKNFQEKTNRILVEFKNKIVKYHESGLRVVIFGAAAKGSTLLNVAGIDSTLIEAAVDSSNVKQSKFIPGTGIIILNPLELKNLKPDVIVILAWNFADEIMKQTFNILAPSKCFLIPIPKVTEVISS
jgi:SAM-dependent methyltransferase